MSHDGVLLELKTIAKEYVRPDGQSRMSVLTDVSLTVRSGESIAIVGPSGSGKSTLLNIIGALDRPTGGEVILNGIHLEQLSDDDLSRIRNRNLGFVFQDHHLLPQFTALENVLIPTLPQPNGDPGAARTRAEELLKEIGLEDRASHHPSQLSGGEALRVAVVRALINGPDLLLADEPTGSLDHRTARDVMALLQRLNKEKGLTLVVVTHALDLAGMMGRRLALSEGRLLPIEA